MKNKSLNEGLRGLDLEYQVKPVFEVDTYKSKMGEDADVCTISFTVADRAPAKDLMEFIEKGYGFVLDADVSAGETINGEYNVFVELERNKDLIENIEELFYGVRKLTGVKNWNFKFYKNKDSIEYTKENLEQVIPSSPSIYEDFMNKVRTEGVKQFFNKTLMDDLELVGNEIIIKKPFGVTVRLEKIDEEVSINESSPSVDENSVAEIFWLTKMLGDYDISKYGDKFLFSNNDKSMLFKRID
jgi:hypothetical protein